MKLFTGSLAAGLVLLAGSAQAQVPGPYENGRPPYTAASDFDAPYAVAPHPVAPPQYGSGPHYGYSPGLLPSTEVYSVLRDNGFLPLGIPRLRGFVYTIAAIDRGGEDGRLIIDARNGRIIRFVPAHRMDDNFDQEQSALRGPFMAQPPQAQAPDQVPAAPRPSRPAHVASRAVPMPKASPIAAKPAPVQQMAAPAPKSKSAEVQAAAPVTTGSAPAKPVPQIAPTQDMPTMQGLE
ncbi:hypothetical protein [Bradyrhizobium sp. AZCC 1693]|uniref:hypothetical protein n=1 Tax=Bradyrhizobium sp. AZCC 1693 TaxID=3117029 RepID=UPI002FF30A5B